MHHDRPEAATVRPSFFARAHWSDYVALVLAIGSLVALSLRV